MNANKQKGMSFFGWLLALVLAGFFASVAFKVIPHYMDNKALVKIITSVERDKSVGAKIKGPADFYTLIDRGMQVNNIYDLSARDAMEIKAEGGEFLVKMNYEKRESILKNMAIVLSFDKEYRVRAQ